ncbi:MAG: rhodanese-like domain-containing protein [Alphaproteobacteria bacterium]|nr:rhodanese-like domain-containing protein [Alphaproteobacteria bacterium]
MKRTILLAVVFAAFAGASAVGKEIPRATQAQPAQNRQVDYNGFAALTADLAPYREARRVDLARFKTMAGEDDTLILDARSARAYGEGHIAGAINLPFTEFTDESLAAALGPDRNRRILIYCNNNFSNNAQPVPVKAVRLALNIPTFINLYGYGYPNIYELADIVDFNDPAVGWVKASAKP